MDCPILPYIDQGPVVFVPAQGHNGLSAGGPISNGEFKIDHASGLAPGPHRVEIRATRVSGTTTVKGIEGAEGGLSGGGSFDKIEMYIPAKYNTQSTLIEEISDDKSQLDFALAP
ncbi:hypothetical protein [Thalassoroseus pseudoceratinae]|uniref:hypothetical protein n=1 Tax=Thalassoroseus pseudoceratinae TaxID=2713176 RepID=UPI0014221CF6|nr:hypothetical protein [Thalassoroseus pseudoceratinae]